MFFKMKKHHIKIDLSNIPKHIAIIPDGNRRWAKKRGMPAKYGHREGSNLLKKIVIHCDKIGVKYLTCYVFSTENWKREKEEVEALMELLYEFLKNAKAELEGSKVRIRIMGNKTGLSSKLLEEIERVEEMTKNEPGVVMNICLNYGSRKEIIEAVKSVCVDVKNDELYIDELDEEKFSNYLYNSDIPDPDLVIRTSNEKRISNFLLWQIAYSELYFSKQLWPDFSINEFEYAILEYQKRTRRFGGA